ncbi:hypothetical protein [Gilliamella sp. BG7]|uniref:relaxosome protein TraM n=1 Tax=unclassified Gilliamella TaxID=2685620 RepID=UPI00398839BD
MARVIQISISDKDYEIIKDLISKKEFIDYEGNYITKITKVGAFLFNLGLRVHLSSKHKNHFDIKEYRYELLKRVLQNLQLSKALFDMFNELPNFENRNLIDEFFNKNNKSINWIETEMNKFFNKNE